MTTALIDYTASMTNSEYLVAYTDSRTLLPSPRIGNSASAVAFGDAEGQVFAIFDAHAQDARRSTIDCLDRGLLMLKNLKTNHRRGLDAYARKEEIPEDAWVSTGSCRISSVLRSAINPNTLSGIRPRLLPPLLRLM